MQGFLKIYVLFHNNKNNQVNKIIFIHTDKFVYKLHVLLYFVTLYDRNLLIIFVLPLTQYVNKCGFKKCQL